MFDLTPHLYRRKNEFPGVVSHFLLFLSLMTSIAKPFPSKFRHRYFELLQ